MSYLINNQQHLNDVIFSGRNQGYGAYAIRSAYGSTVFKSLFIVVSSFCTFMGLAYYFSNRNNTPDQKNDQLVIQDSAVNIIFDMKPDEPLKPEAASEAPPATTTEPPENEVVNINDTLATETRSVLNAVADVNLSTTNPSTVSGKGDLASTGHSSVSVVEGTTTVDVPVETYLVDQEPEFEGGLKALYKFISDNLRYPAAAVEAGKQGTVYVKFVVSERGKVEKVILQNNLGYGMDEEAKRVVSLVPNFKTPAKVKGQAVKVYYQLPIRYKLR